ncbi:MAG: LPS assembly protein LptD [Gammaproteobacteria bacterium]|nr:LPS assembly protein LptD [Gammaproteobacteria bacterium]
MQILILLALVLFSYNAFAQTDDFPTAAQCHINSPRLAPSQLPTLEQLTNPNKLFVISDTTEINYPNQLSYQGNVELIRGKTYINAQRAEIDRESNSFIASGNLHYQDDQITLTSDSLRSSLDGKNTELVNSKYWFNGQSINGKADKFRVINSRFLILDKALLTTCAGDRPDWSLRAKKITIDAAKERAIIRQATLEVFEVPVFYFPYLSLPISDKRASGLLYPSIGSSSNNGIDISVPYYWNIAPEYDLTLTPRIMTNHGLQLTTEFRYLVEDQQGLFNLEFLPSDKAADDSERYLFHWSHSGKIDNNWRVTASYTKLSDDNYFNTIGSDYGSSSDSQITNYASLSYFKDNWTTAIKIQDIDVFGTEDTPYQLLPQLSFNSYNNTLAKYLEYDIFSEFSYFKNTSTSEDDAARVHLEPILRLPIDYAAGSFTTELTLHQTWYQQKNSSDSSNESISRTVPQLRINSNLNFERETSLFGRDYFQTIEPQIQYLYVPFKDQSDIGLYDTALLSEDYFGLFRSRRFSGLDRIADANQMTLGVTNRFIDSNNQEKLKVSVGQIYYFSQSQTTLDGTEADSDTSSTSALAGEIDFRASDQWYFSGSVQLNEEYDAINQNKISLEYRRAHNKLIQISHRYVRDISDSQVDQLGIQAIWPINNDWTFVGNYYRDINLHRTIESLIGLQYESCCWSIRLQAYRQLNTNYEDSSSTSASTTFDTGVSFSFQIKGLGSQQKLQATEMLENGQFGYREPYYLNN